MRAIIAKNNIGFIGLNNSLPWINYDDLAHFKKMTNGGILLAGFNTFKTLPTLKGRKVILDERDKLIEDFEDIWCIGGKKTYEKYCHLFEELHISHINNNTKGDTLFPDLINLNPHCRIFNYHF